MKHQGDIERGAHEARCQPFSGNGGAVAAPDHNQGQGSFLKNVSVFGAAGAIVVALMGLLAYMPGLGLLGSIREGYIPMAPSTAVSFIVLGGILLAITLRSRSGANLVLFGALSALVSLFGALEIAGHFTGRDLSFEDALVPSVGYLHEIPIARMSPSTGALFLLAGFATIALLLRIRTHGRETRLGHCGGSLGCLVFGASSVFCLAYVYGSPLLYGRGATVPMALTTALAFLMLGAATVGVSGEDAFPVSLLASARRAGERISARKRLLLLTLIMVGACAMVMTIMTVVLYRHELQEHRETLKVTAQSQARLIEAVARYSARMAGLMRNGDLGHDASTTTLNQIIDAHERYEGFGETGEFTLARRDGDSIVFVLRHRHSGVGRPAPVAFDSDLAEPMRRALKGLSGTVIGLDYRGETVLAAHEPVAGLNLGIVAKIDLDEIRAPFIRSGLSAAAVALLVILAGTVLFFRIGNPIIARLEAQTGELKSEVTQRRESEGKLLAFMESATEGFVVYDSGLNLSSINKTALGIFPAGSTEENLRGKHILEMAPGLKETGRYDEYVKVVRTGKPVHFDEIVPDPRFGARHLSVHAFSAGDSLGIILTDITERKRAEEELEKHRKHLEDLVRERTVQLDERIAGADELNSAMANVMEDLRASNQELEATGRELMASNKELDAFSYSVSHDLRAPLRHIAGFVGLLLKREKERLDPTSWRYLETIAESSTRLGRLIDDLLAFSRTGRAETHLRRVDSNEVVHEALNELSPMVEGRRVTWEVGDLPAVEADRGLLRLVWENLISNAIKYTGQCDEAHIEIGAIREGDEQGDTVFFVRDNGVGFDPQYTHKLFGVFQRLHRDDQFEGTGIGLATVRRIVDRHGGRVWAEGKVDHGATFYFALKEAGDE